MSWMSTGLMLAAWMRTRMWFGDGVEGTLVEERVRVVG